MIQPCEVESYLTTEVGTDMRIMKKEFKDDHIFILDKTECWLTVSIVVVDLPIEWIPMKFEDQREYQNHEEEEEKLWYDELEELGLIKKWLIILQKYVFSSINSKKLTNSPSFNNFDYFVSEYQFETSLWRSN